MNKLPEKYHIVLSERDIHYTEGMQILKNHFAKMSEDDIFLKNFNWKFWRNERNRGGVHKGYGAFGLDSIYTDADSVQLTLDKFVQLLQGEEQNINLFRFC